MVVAEKVLRFIHEKNCFRAGIFNTGWLSFKDYPELLELISHGVVAGGAVRDTILNKPVKDIDIYIPPTPDVGRIFSGNLARLYDKGVKVLVNNTAEYLAPYLRTVVTLPHFSPYPIQIMLLDIRPVTPYSLLEAFDCTISQCSISLDPTDVFKFHATEQCRQDMINKTLRFNKRASYSYMEKIKTKYSGWYKRVV